MKRIIRLEDNKEIEITEKLYQEIIQLIESPIEKEMMLFPERFEVYNKGNCWEEFSLTYYLNKIEIIQSKWNQHWNNDSVFHIVQIDVQGDEYHEIVRRKIE